MIKDLFKITVGASLLAPTMSAIGTGFTGLGSLGNATKTLVGVGFIGNVAKNVRFLK